MTHSPIAIIGLGLMGEAFARRLIAAGISVIGYDPKPERRRQLAKIGGKSVDSIADLAGTGQCVIIAVFSTEQVEDVIENHLLPAIGENSGKIVLVMSTCDPDRVAALAHRVIPRGIRYLDAPVSGTSDQVLRGDGVSLFGGDPAIVAEVAPVFDALFSHRFHIGKIGDGGRAKLAVNLILGLNRLALAEGLVFAERVGLDPAAFLAVAQGSAAYSQVMDTKGPKMVAGDFAPEGRVKQALKDTQLMLDLAEAVGQPLVALQLHSKLLAACAQSGDAELDSCAIIKEVRRQGRKA